MTAADFRIAIKQKYMLGFLLFIIGILLGMWWWGVIILPLFYGIPKTIYYISKGLLKSKAVIHYLNTFFLWNFIFFAVSLILVKYFPKISNALLESWGFAIGQFIGIGFSTRRVFTKDGRQDLKDDFWDVMVINNYLDTRNPIYKEILALNLTNLFIEKFGEKGEEKLNEFLGKLAKNNIEAKKG